VACSSAASLPEVGGDVVRYFDPKSERSFLTALRASLGDGREARYVEARKAHAAGFSWDAAAKGFVSVLREAAKCGKEDSPAQPAVRKRELSPRRTQRRAEKRTPIQCKGSQKAAARRSGAAR